jgi:uroporphyrinogen decarboxylase
MTMNGRECVLAALNHYEPERLPVDLGGRHATMHVRAHQALKAYLGIEGTDEKFRQFWLQTVEVDPQVNAKLGGDVLSFCTGTPDTWQMELDERTSTFSDEWGATYRMPDGGAYYDYNSHPLSGAKTVADLDRYSWPDPLDPGRFRGLREAIEAAHSQGEKAIMMSISPAGSWEHTWTLRGVEQALMDLALNRNLYEALLERTVAFQIAVWEKVLDLVGDWIDIAALSDDLGTQEGPMISPQVYRQVFKPRLRRIAELIHSRSNAKVYIHTDGSVYSFLPDLINAGIEVINPVQIECRDMAAEKLKREFGRDLTFWGAGCNTRTLELGSPDDVRAQAQHAIRELGPGGGYIFAAIHNIQPNVPPQNIVALFNTARDAGRYPINVSG